MRLWCPLLNYQCDWKYRISASDCKFICRWSSCVGMVCVTSFFTTSALERNIEFNVRAGIRPRPTSYPFSDPSHQ